ncbi:MAG: AroB-related putative sugar phosphate phospholyase (cyclizing) [Nitrososphaeria archaeon]|jgi:3-dehydroquinate synthase
MSTLKELKVKSNIKDYSIIFVDDFSEALIKNSSEKSFYIIDQSVFYHYKDKLHSILAKQKHLIVEASESHKTLDYAQTIIKLLINNSIKRDDRLVAIGGGIIQDITGFVSSILFRGIAWILYPTTLLSQSDSCIGSKTSINVGEFKNQLGTYYPPDHIVLDFNFLKTLSLIDIKSGLGEIIKVHLLDGEDSLEYILSHYTESASSPVLNELILRSLSIKKKIIEKDEFDRDYRNILNYGHTFGHAIESITSYKVCHGQAVTIGMDMANYISFRLGILPEKSYQQMRKALEKNYPDIRLESEQMEPFLVALSKDKKNVDENLSFILTKGPGEMLKRKLPIDDSLKQYLNDYRSIQNAS